ncbi:MAG TPA: hypothetical protein VF644_11635 [Pyrinomonadaceae bacterium]|jgi:hypothetical protein
MSKVEVIVKVEDSSADKMSDIARQCEQAGMRVGQQMKSLGMISGEVERANIGKLERIRGVAYVEESREIKL